MAEEFKEWKEINKLIDYIGMIEKAIEQKFVPNDMDALFVDEAQDMCALLYEYHKLIIEKLEAVERGEVRKLMIFVPPQNGKSEIASINFPAWFFGRNPKKAIIAASYNSDLAVNFGRKARNIVASPEYRNLFNVSLSEDSKAACRWLT